MKSIIFGIILGITFFIVGCNKNDNEKSDYDKAIQYCKDNNGTVVESTKNSQTLCQYKSVYNYDDGEQVYTNSCEVETFYTNQKECYDLADEGIDTILPLTEIEDNNLTLREAFYIQITNILKNMKNTGYTHRTHGPFVLHPSYTELIKMSNNKQTKLNLDIDSFNLFLDCSGFVGYYIVQGIAKHLYEDINTCYHSSRPLAADFADTFKESKYKTTYKHVKDALLSDLDNNVSAVIWGRVPHIKDALPGDIIVYKHTENIDHHGKCDNTVNGNTGHVLFVMDKPHLSSIYCKEWLVRVADSTTAPHSKDSRYSNTGKGTVKYGSKIFNKSSYDDNEYTAWTKRYNKGDVKDSYYDPSGEVISIDYKHNDWLELCKTDTKNTFHRRCSKFNDALDFKIFPQTKHTNSSTGIGVGYIYISDDMKKYRVKKGADHKKAAIYIGRPVKISN